MLQGMVLSIPLSEPATLRAGNTWQWTRELDYPASTWTLTYHFRNSSEFFDVVATPVGDAFSVLVDAPTTRLIAAGRYDWLAVVSDGSARHEIDAGALLVLPDFADAASVDARSFPRKLLDMVEAAILNRATTDQLDVIEATLAQRGMKRSPGTMLALRSQLQAEIKRDENAEAMRNGRPSKSRLMIRFGRT